MTSRPVLFAALAAMLAASLPASAEEPETVDPDGLDLGIRLGFAYPLGSVVGVSGDLGSVFNGLVPVTLEAGRRFKRLYTVEPFFQYGRALVKGGGTTSDYVLGLQIIYRIDASGPIAPWIGFGAGYEFLGLGGGQSVRGVEFGTLQAGGEFQPVPGFGIGPFVNFSFGEFMTASDGSTDQDIGDPGVHGWIELGLRLNWSLSPAGS